MQRKGRLCSGTSLHGILFRGQKVEEKCLDVLEIGRGKLDRVGFHPHNFPQTFPKKHFFCMLIKKTKTKTKTKQTSKKYRIVSKVSNCTRPSETNGIGGDCLVVSCPRPPGRGRVLESFCRALTPVCLFPLRRGIDH